MRRPTAAPTCLAGAVIAAALGHGDGLNSDTTGQSDADWREEPAHFSARERWPRPVRVDSPDLHQARAYYAEIFSWALARHWRAAALHRNGSPHHGTASGSFSP